MNNSTAVKGVKSFPLNSLCFTNTRLIGNPFIMIWSTTVLFFGDKALTLTLDSTLLQK